MALLLPVVGGAPGCSGESRYASQVQVRDSAGIQIVESSANSATLAPFGQVAATPLISIGEGADSASQLSEVVTALRLDDGSIVVADRGTRDLRVFDASGRLIRRIGRAGTGPGEFRTISRLQKLPGDSLLVFDVLQRRVTVFTKSGQIARHGIINSGDLFSIAGAFRDANLLGIGSVLYDQQLGIVAQDIRLAWLSSSMDSSVAFGTFPGDDVYFQREPDGELSFGPPHFGRKTFLLVGSDHFHIARSSASEVKRYSRSGELEQIVRWRGERHEITRKDHNVMIDSMRAVAAFKVTALIETRWREEISHLETLPAFKSALRDDQQNIWLRDYEPPGQGQGPQRWLIVSPRGEMLGHIVTPALHAMLSAGTDYILALAENESGAPVVRLFSISGR